MRLFALFCLLLLLTPVQGQKTKLSDAQLAHWRALLPQLGPTAILDSCAKALRGPASRLQTAALYSLQGSALRMAGQLPEALERHRRALQLRRQSLGEQHEDTANSYQNMANCYFYLDELEAAKMHYLKSLAIKTGVLGADNPALILLYNNLGNCYQRDQNPEKAVFYLEKALRIAEKAHDATNDQVRETLGNLGVALSQQNPGAAVPYFERAIAIAQERGDTAALALLHNNLGVAHLYMGAYPAASADFETAARYYSALANPDPIEYGNCLQNKGSALLRLRDASGALQSFGQAFPFFQRPVDQAGLLQNMGLAYRYRGDASKAIDLLNEALNLLPETGTAVLRSGILVNLGDCYLDLRQKQSAQAALIYFEKARVAVQHTPGPALARCWNKIGVAHLSMGNHGAAEAAFQRALNQDPGPAIAFAAWINLAETAERAQAPATAQTCLRHAAEVLVAQTGKAVHYPYEQAMLQAASATLQYRAALKSKKTADWTKALQMALATMEQVAQLKNYQQEEEAFWAARDDFYDAYSIAVAAYHALGQAEEALMVAERAKDYFFRRLLQSEKLQNPELPSLSAVQALLHDRQTIVAYHWGIDQIFAFVIRRDHMDLVPLPADTSLVEQLEQFFMACAVPPDKLPDHQQMPAYRSLTSLGHALYQRLLAPLSLRPEEDLLLVPDAGLHYLAFEALLTAPVAEAAISRCRSHPYLIRKHTVGYVHSTAVFVALRGGHPSAAPRSMLTMAPDFTGNGNNLRLLLHSQAEGGSVHQIMGGDVWLGQEALKATFLREAPHYRVLYLATHGEAYDREPGRSFLAFSEPPGRPRDALLPVQEMDSLSLDADLGVLSACRTAIGRLYRGEGFLSITRSLQVIGIRAVVASLWNVDDQQSPKLMRLLMQGLKNGLDKPAALAAAKCTYLDEASHIKAHPFYWAGLLTMGNDRPIASQRHAGWLWGVVALGLLLIAYWVYGRRRWEG